MSNYYAYMMHTYCLQYYDHLFFSIPCRLGFPCPEFFNPADHYIHKLSMIPREEDEYHERIDRICNEFASSEFGAITNDELGERNAMRRPNYLIPFSGASVEDELHSQISGRENRFGNADFNLSSLRPYKSPWLQQFRAVLWRSWHSVVKEPLIARIRIIEAIVSSAIYSTRCSCSARRTRRR